MALFILKMSLEVRYIYVIITDVLFISIECFYNIFSYFYEILIYDSYFLQILLVFHLGFLMVLPTLWIGLLLELSLQVIF